MRSTAAFRLATRLGPLLCLLFPAAAQAQSIIKQPGNHADYTVELEPHLAFQWAGRVGVDNAFGPGARVNIPFLRNGPIRTINNNMAISFGLDVTFGDGGNNWCYGRYDRGRWPADAGCSVTEVWLPVAAQWNFYLTKVISVFGELGFAIAHRRWSYDIYCNGGSGPYCEQRYRTTDPELITAGGARFMFSDKIGATIRLGYPMLTVGANFLF